MDKSQFTAHAPIRSVKIDDAFWSPFMERVRTEVIPYQWLALNDNVEGADPSYSMRNFKLAAQLTHSELDYGVSQDAGHGGFVFQDSDIAKWLEAVAYSLVWHPDAALEKTADDAIDIICNAQQPDGYLDTYYIINGLDKRFTNLKDNHELYCLGHFIEGAVAYYEATGKRKLLDAMIRYVACVTTHIGPEAGKLHGYPGHEIIEMALVRLYNITGDDAQFKLAKYFIDERGKKPLYFEEETARNGNDFYWKDSYAKYQYYQAGKPVAEQKQAEGHAVRAVYLYSGMTDIARLTGDDTLAKACAALWHNIAHRQLYITGSIGQQSYGEAFSFDYDLPNDTIYGETCAAIGLAFFAKRMTELAPKGEYADVLEKALYNGIISGMSLDGKRFFYVNPLEVLPEACEKDRKYRHVKPERQKWFACACCPPNIARIVASLGTYIHSSNDAGIWTHLFVGSDAALKVAGTDVGVSIKTEYPWQNKVAVRFSLKAPAKFRYALRTPGWCKKSELLINGKPVNAAIADGYFVLDREWRDGDEVTLTLALEPAIVEANPHVRNNAGQAALTYGPLVYCLEEADNGKDLAKLRIGKPKTFSTAFKKELLGGVTTVEFTGGKVADWDEDVLYQREGSTHCEDKELRWIPYYAWANRGLGEMRVWVIR